jgi:hypothetical protein
LALQVIVPGFLAGDVVRGIGGFLISLAAPTFCVLGILSAVFAVGAWAGRPQENPAAESATEQPAMVHPVGSSTEGNTRWS